MHSRDFFMPKNTFVALDSAEELILRLVVSGLTALPHPHYWPSVLIFGLFPINPPAPNCTFWLRSFVSLFCYLLQYSCVILMNDLDVLKLWPEYVLKCDSIKQSKHTTECHCRA